MPALPPHGENIDYRPGCIPCKPHAEDDLRLCCRAPSEVNSCAGTSHRGHHNFSLVRVSQNFYSAPCHQALSTVTVTVLKVTQNLHTTNNKIEQVISLNQENITAKHLHAIELSLKRL